MEVVLVVDRVLQNKREIKPCVLINNEVALTRQRDDLQTCKLLRLQPQDHGLLVLNLVGTFIISPYQKCVVRVGRLCGWWREHVFQLKLEN